MNSRFLISQIVADGWYLVRIKGSHHHFKHPTKPGLVTVPHPKKDLLKKRPLIFCNRRCSDEPMDSAFGG